jgi:Fuc2NAc and GlcNAc transferase
MSNIVFYILAFIISYFLTLLYRKYALHKALLDIPNDRSSHTIPTPRGGGLAIALVWYLGLIFFKFQNKIEPGLFYALISGIPLTIIGLADDMFNLKPRLRFLVHFFSAIIGLYFLGGLHLIDLGFISLNFSDNLIGYYLVNLLVIIAIIWFINLFNFLDGIDGYLGSELVFLGGAYFIFTGNLLGLLLISAVGGFLIWNWPKAKIFMGDVGSTLSGFIIAIFIIYFQNSYQISVITSLILTSVFWFDATVTIIRRFLNKENLSEAHRKHAFQRIVQAGFSHDRTVVYSIGLNFICFGLAYCSIIWSSLFLLFFILDISIISFVYIYIEKKKPFDRNA